MVSYVLSTDALCPNIEAEKTVRELDGCKIKRELYGYITNPLVLLSDPVLSLENHPNNILAIGIYEIKNFVKRATLRKYLLTWLLLENKSPSFLVSKIEEKTRKSVYRF